MATFADAVRDEENSIISFSGTCVHTGNSHLWPESSLVSSICLNIGGPEEVTKEIIAIVLAKPGYLT